MEPSRNLSGKYFDATIIYYNITLYRISLYMNTTNASIQTRPRKQFEIG